MNVLECEISMVFHIPLLNLNFFLTKQTLVLFWISKIKSIIFEIYINLTNVIIRSTVRYCEIINVS